MTSYDVIIVGGGLSGLSLSCMLGRSGMRIACVDQQDPKDALSEDLRTTAISYGSAQILEPYNIWPLSENKMCPIRDIEILDGDSPVLLEFLSDEVDGKDFGWIVLNSDLRVKLMGMIEDLPTVDHFAPMKVEDYTVGDNDAQVMLSNGETLTAQLIVGADGRGSPTRGFMDIDVRQWSYEQQAVVCTVAHENPHNNVAVEHFWPQGPFAILPMSDSEDGQHRSGVVFTEHGKGTESWADVSDGVFQAALAERFPERYGWVKMVSARKAYPLNLVHAKSYTGPRMVLVADAGHGIHPIAGQGLNLGFRDLGLLCTLLEKAYTQGEDLGDESHLRVYERKRRLDNMVMIGMTDGLVRLFSNNLKTVGFARRLGLRAVAKLKPAKQFFMKRAMGE